jgi:hypothetical protein
MQVNLIAINLRIMNKKLLITILLLSLLQISFAQKKDIKIIIKEAKEAFNTNDYETALQKIHEIKIEFKNNTPPPFILSMEIISKSDKIKNNPLGSYELIEETRNLMNNYLKNPNSKKDTNYNSVIVENRIFTAYPKDLATFNLLKEEKQKQEALENEQKQKQIAIEKQRLEQQVLEAKQIAEADSIKKIEEVKINRIVTDRKNRLRPYTNPEMFSAYQLSKLSEIEFNEQLDKVIQESIERQAYEKKISDIKEGRLVKLEDYRAYVSYENLNNLGIYTEREFEQIYQKAKADFKSAKKRNKPQLGAFSSLGFQSGEIAKYGFIYEHGGRKTVGFRFSARTSLTPEEDILTGKVIENKTEIELGPNFKLLKRFYFNIGVGYGYYDSIINNDYAGEFSLEKTGYSVATTGLMIRLSRVININGGASFMDIDKDIYKPEITFGISFNLKGKYSY